MQQTVPESLGRVLDRIGDAARRSGRDAETITLVAVTKTVPFEKVLPFVQAGVHHLGENRVQEALMKYQMPDGTKRAGAAMHLIGPLQTNKAKKAAAFFDLVQSLDRWELAQHLDRHARALGKRLACLVEVKISPEKTKTGVAPEAVNDFLKRVGQLPGLEVRGLMGIAPFDAQGPAARPYFARLRRLFEDTKLKVLSMGMSADFETAIEEGATLVRLGRALFGARA